MSSVFCSPKILSDFYWIRSTSQTTENNAPCSVRFLWPDEGRFTRFGRFRWMWNSQDRVRFFSFPLPRYHQMAFGLQHAKTYDKIVALKSKPSADFVHGERGSWADDSENMVTSSKRIASVEVSVWSGRSPCKRQPDAGTFDSTYIEVDGFI